MGSGSLSSLNRDHQEDYFGLIYCQSKITLAYLWEQPS